MSHVHKQSSDLTTGGVATTTTPTGTGTPPVITLTGTLTDKTLKGVWVRCVTLGGPRGTWLAEYSEDNVSWTGFTSAATQAVGSSGLTINIATGNATIGDAWFFDYKTGSVSAELDLGLAPPGACAVEITGTYSTIDLVAEGSVSGSSWVLLQFEPIPSGSAVDHITPTAGLPVVYYIPRKAMAKIRVRNLKITSGTVSVALCVSREGF